VQWKNVLVANVLAETPLNIGFRRELTGNKWNGWLHLCQRLMMVPLYDNPDAFVWKLTSTGLFFCQISVLRPNERSYEVFANILVEIEDFS
jgi:hypothetical protein